jgi:hypothetical protein
MPVVPMAAGCGQPMVLPGDRYARTVFRRVPDPVEYVYDARALSRLRASLAVDVVPEMRGLVAA